MGTTITLTGAGDPVVITGEGVYEGATYDRLIGWHDLDADLRLEQRPSAPGAFAPRRTYTEARAISVEGQYFGSSRADALRMRERIARLYNDGRPILMTVADDLRTTSREVYVESIVFPWTIHREFRFDLDVRAPDPRRYGPATTATTGPAVSAGGLSLPLVFPVDFGIAGDDGRLTAVNVGNTSTGQRFTVSGGGMPDGFDIVNTTTGQRIRYLGPVSSELVGTELIATNLATNPSFETGAGTVEVRRNLATDPLQISNGIASNNSNTWTATRNVDMPPGNPQGITKGGSITPVAGAVTTLIGSAFNLDALGGSSSTPERFLGVWVYSNVQATARFVGRGDIFNLPANTWVWVTTNVPIPAATHINFQITKASGNAVPGTDIAYVTGATALSSEIPSAAIWGSRSAGGDFTYAWTGTANASASVQNAVGVAGLVSQSVSWQSGEWSSSGTKSLRIRPTAVTNNSFYRQDIATVVGRHYTALATIRLDSPLAGSLSSFSRRLRALSASTDVTSTQPENVAGVTVVRVNFTATESTTQFIFYNGASAGGGDVWWDDFALIEGTYTGDYFDGNTPDTYRTVYSWSGAPDASTSTATRQLYSESFVVVDTRLRTALINGTAPAARFLASPEWWEVPAGSSVDIQFVPRGPTTGSPILTAETASAFY